MSPSEEAVAPARRPGSCRSSSAGGTSGYIEATSAAASMDRTMMVTKAMTHAANTGHTRVSGGGRSVVPRSPSGAPATFIRRVWRPSISSPPSRRKDARLHPGGDPDGQRMRDAGDLLERGGASGPVAEHEGAVDVVEDAVEHDGRHQHVVEVPEERDEVG